MKPCQRIMVGRKKAPLLALGLFIGTGLIMNGCQSDGARVAQPSPEEAEPKPKADKSPRVTMPNPRQIRVVNRFSGNLQRTTSPGWRLIKTREQATDLHSDLTQGIEFSKRDVLVLELGSVTLPVVNLRIERVVRWRNTLVVTSKMSVTPRRQSSGRQRQPYALAVVPVLEQPIKEIVGVFRIEVRPRATLVGGNVAAARRTLVAPLRLANSAERGDNRQPASRAIAGWGSRVAW